LGVNLKQGSSQRKGSKSLPSAGKEGFRRRPSLYASAGHGATRRGKEDIFFCKKKRMARLDVTRKKKKASIVLIMEGEEEERERSHLGGRKARHATLYVAQMKGRWTNNSRLSENKRGNYLSSGRVTKKKTKKEKKRMFFSQERGSRTTCQGRRRREKKAMEGGRRTGLHPSAQGGTKSGNE